MAEPRQKLQLTIGHWITIGVFLVGIITTWAGITTHISDENIHLTEEQRNALIKFTTLVDTKLPIIETNEQRMIDLEKEFFGFKIMFDNLYEEHEGLENKVSRNYVELNNKIDKSN